MSVDEKPKEIHKTSMLSSESVEQALPNSPSKDAVPRVNFDKTAARKSFMKKRMSTQRDVVNTGLDSSIIDDERKRAQAYDYLCRIGEAKEWIEACIKVSIPPIEELDEELRNGIILAQLGKAFQPDVVKKIFKDKSKLQFRHSDNINYFLSACRTEGLPEIFFFELTDLYEKKNIPKVIYCIHAYSFLLAKLGKAPHIKNLIGQLEFSEEVLKETVNELAESAVPMPDFGDIGKDLDKEMNAESEEDRLKREEEERAKEEAERLQKEEEERAKEEAERLQKEKERQKQTTAAVQIQSQFRSFSQRKLYKEKILRFQTAAHIIVKLQARFKAKKARENYIAIKQELLRKLPQIISIQAWWRGITTRREYNQLRIKNNHFGPKQVQKFIHLLHGVDEDDDEEKLVEELRGLVIQKIRENLAAEANLNELDSKVALLVKNRISVQEVARLKSKDMRAVLARNAAQQEKDGGVLTLKGSDKDTIQKRKKYEELFYILQTEPRYLSQLMYTINKISGGSSTKFLEQVVLTLFGYAQNSREEYLFLRLMETSALLEISEASTIFETLKDNPMFVKLVLQYTRGVKEREYLRDLLRPLLESIMNDTSLELDVDPISLYKTAIRNEEATTGEKSKRVADNITNEIALQDAEVNAAYLHNVSKLESLTHTFLESIVKSVQKMPFGIRYICMKIKQALKAKFPSKEQEKEIELVIGNILYYRYINPVIIAPEAFDVIETSVSPMQRKNLAEIAKVLHKITTGRFGKLGTDNMKDLGVKDSNPALFDDTEFEQNMISAVSKFSKFLEEASTVVSAEEFFGIDEFHDSGGVKCTVYITPDEIIQVHHSLVDNMSHLIKSDEDPLKLLLDEMGSVPELGSAARGPGSEVVLKLSNRFGKVSLDEQAPARKLLKETKKIILLIMRFCSGTNLMDILEQVPTAAHEEQLNAFIKQQETVKANSPSPLSATSKSHQLESPGSRVDLNLVGLPVYKNADDSNITLAQIKVKALENMSKLEEYGMVTKNDKYQSMLDQLVEDLVTKNRRRSQIQRELLSLRKTLATLGEKATFLEEATQSYHDYVDSCMAQLNKTGKVKKAPLLFSRQYFHIQDLKKTGQVPQFGSFKYTAAELYKKGVLISLEDVSPSKFSMINLIISSNESGVFQMEVTLLGADVASKEELKLEDLLQRQYNKEDVITLFDTAKVNLNLLIFLINKKFYA